MSGSFVPPTTLSLRGLGRNILLVMMMLQAHLHSPIYIMAHPTKIKKRTPFLHIVRLCTPNPTADPTAVERVPSLVLPQLKVS
ncbi:hypothetical protein DFH08DRAFT_884313 [Mycena albidolilacea]|uniref:Uncharacterized protein n=1 Tax=Mycena albidolilacea TaxID=1033008 RepID=A0AAD6ZLG6_9AGAR|nr:hypothetical protein DFH08DRAFT_884313 [Mycena albidolilacea]